MTQTDGEKELVLGNKQLVSFFFVVLALCGVFFALGYMIGRNSSKTTVLGSDTGTTGSTAATVSPMPRNQDSEPLRVSETAPVPVPAAADVPAPARTEPVSEAPRENSARETPVREIAAPEAGALYLQVTALRRGDAENLVKTLREQNFPALLAASSKPDLFRVMVGPYHQTALVADAKARLKTLGFGDAILKK